jgi:hypothetical protein
VDIGAYEYQWPRLTIAPSGVLPSGIILSWPINNAGYDYTGFTLQSTTNPVSPAVWTTNLPAPVVVAGQNTVTNFHIAGGSVEIGAYEFQAPVSMISYAWLQQFNLPVNSSIDAADPDGDGVNNYREWLAGTDPTNPFSFPPLLTLIPYGPNVILTWATNAFGFRLQSTTNLVSPFVWTRNSPALVVIDGQNVIINPITGPQQFYRLKQ